MQDDRTTPALRQRGGRRDARLRVGRGAADHAAGAARRRVRLLHRGRLAADGPDGYPTRARARAARTRAGDVRIVNRATGEERWRVTKSRGVRDSRGRAAAGGQRHRGHHRAQALRARAAAALAHRRRARVLARLRADAAGRSRSLAVPELADWCGVSMPDRHGVIRQVAVAHSDPAKVEFARDFGARYPTHTSDEGGSGAGPARRAGPADPRDPRRAARAGRRRTPSSSS